MHGGVGGWSVHGWVSFMHPLHPGVGCDGQVGMGMMGGWA